MKKIEHFYKKINYEIIPTEETLKIAEKFKVEEYNQNPSFDLSNRANKEKVNFKGLISSFEMVITEKTHYLKGKLTTGGTSVIEFKVWKEKAARFEDLFKNSKYVGITGEVNEYQGKKSIIIEEAVPLDTDSIEVFDLLPKTTVSRNELIVELLHYISELSEPYKKICLDFLEKYHNHFFNAPAALGHHHNYIGGLLKHTVGLMRMAKFVQNYDNPVRASLYLQNVASNQYINAMWEDYISEKPTLKRDYELTWNGAMDHFAYIVRSLSGFTKVEPDIDWNVVYTAILFHDSGKVFEYSYLGEDDDKFKLLYPKVKVTEFNKGSISMDSNKGQGHIPLGAMVFMDIYNSAENVELTTTEIAKVNNSLFAHHGKAEWGSPSRFEYSEAVIVHLSDYCDSKFESDDEIK